MDHDLAGLFEHLEACDDCQQLHLVVGGIGIGFLVFLADIFFRIDEDTANGADVVTGLAIAAASAICIQLDILHVYFTTRLKILPGTKISFTIFLPST